MARMLSGSNAKHPVRPPFHAGTSVVQVIGEGLRSRIDERRVTEVEVGVYALNPMLDIGRPNYVRIV
jgi:hypothetical protein